MTPQELSNYMHSKGLPIEWLTNVFEWTPKQRRLAIDIYYSIPPTSVHAFDEEDGLHMLDMIRQPYRGHVPYWSQLALISSRIPYAVAMKRFNTSETTLWRWKTVQVYDPITLKRLRMPGGCWEKRMLI